MKSNIFSVSILSSILMIFVFFVNVGYVGGTSTPSISVTVPSNVIAYVPITLKANGPVTANAQIMINLQANSYTTYENPNLQNIEFFYSNGTIIPSWLEGNVLNPSTISSNNNVLYWLKISNPNFLSSAGTSNTLYMGFGSTSTNFFNSQTVGESPILSPSYGEYDNGNQIFNYYQSFGGFTGNTLPKGWSSVIDTSEPSTNTVVVNNPSNTVIYVSNDIGGCGCGIYETAPQSMNVGNTIEWYGNIFNNQMAGTFVGIETESSTTFPLPLYTWNYEVGAGVSQTSVLTYGLSELVSSPGQSGTITLDADENSVSTGVQDTNSNKVYGIQINSQNSFNGLINYASIGQNTNSQLSGTSNIFAFSVGLNPAGNILSLPQSIYWLRTRTNVQMPNLIFGPITPVPFTANLLVTPTLVFNGSSVGFTASVSGGTSPYSYTFNVYNSLMDLDYSFISQTNTFNFQIPKTGNYLAQVVVTDSSSPSNQIATSANVPFNAIPFNGIVLSSNAMTIDLGQSINIGINDINSQSNGNDVFDLFLTNSTSQTSKIKLGSVEEKLMPIYNSFTPNSVGPITYSVTGEMVSPLSYPKISNSITIQVNPALSLSVSSSATSVIRGSTEKLTATVSGGTSPYSYQWYSISGSTNTLISGATSNTIAPSTSTSGTYTYGVNVIDSANAVAYSNPISFTVTSPTTTGPINTGGLPPTTITTPPVQTIPVPTTTVKPTTTTNQNINAKPTNTTTNNSVTASNTIKSSGTNKTVSTNTTKNTTTTVKQAVASTPTAFPWWIILLIIIIILILLYLYMKRRKHNKHGKK
ncbi:MAG: hypothetical protein QXD23_01545 [Candidatus Micrarchaeaceae archaeon]